MRANTWHKSSPLRRSPLLLVAGVAVFASCVPDTAAARSYRTNNRPAVAEKREAAKPAPPPGPVLAVVSIAKQRITVYGAGGVLGHSPVSSGRPGYATPTGVFTILQKNRFHRSNIYSGAPMPFMQRLTWSGVALHAGALPGFPASHGCIRLPASFAQDLWGITKLGARVVVAPDDVHPVEVAHAALPRAILMPPPVGAGIDPPASIKTAALGDDAPVSPARLLNPVERAKLMKTSTVADAVVKTKAAKEAMELSTARAKEANKAIAALRSAELQFADARARLAAAAKAVEIARNPDAAERAKTAVAAAQARLDDATRAVEEAAAAEATVTASAFEAARAAWTAEKQSDAAAAAMKLAERGGEPLSIFVSKKAGRIFIKQGWPQVHEAPVTFKDPVTPLGTHVYLALEPVGEGPDLRWMSVSMAGSNPPDGKSQYGRRIEKAKVAPPVLSRETAASALDRFELDERTKTFIAERLWAGAVLIVSDQGISNETSTHTDFVVLTR